MQPDKSEGERQLVELAQHALVAMQLGGESDALDELASVRAETDTVAGAQELMLLLFAECSSMVTTLGDGGSTPVKVQVFDEAGTEVTIDQADPPVRTAVRTLLAEVHGNEVAAAEQVEIALANADVAEVDSLVLQALRWTIRLSAECIQRDLSIAEWISDALVE